MEYGGCGYTAYYGKQWDSVNRYGIRWMWIYSLLWEQWDSVTDMEYRGCGYTAYYWEQWDSEIDMEYRGCWYTAYYGEQWDSVNRYGIQRMLIYSLLWGTMRFWKQIWNTEDVDIQLIMGNNEIL